MPDIKGGIYQRGQYWLDYLRDKDGAAKSDWLYIHWYDPEKRRGARASTGTTDPAIAQLKLDIHYLKRTKGYASCPACGQDVVRIDGHFIAEAISDYFLDHGDKQSSAVEIKSRLNHVLDYLEAESPAATCDAVDDAWVARFREWSQDQPLKTGAKRSPSTTESAVLQLRAALNHAYNRKAIAHKPSFMVKKPREVNNSPRYRLSVSQMRDMLDYALQQKGRGEALYRYLVAAMGTLGRPDAVLDISTDPARGQWDSSARLLNLNPIGRQQTRKYRAHVPVPNHLANMLDNTSGYFIQNKRGRVMTIRNPWGTMRRALGLPDEVGSKSIRRSMARELRMRGAPNDELELFLGHRTLNSTTEIYAPDSPDYLSATLATIEDVFSDLNLDVLPDYAQPARKSG